MIPNEQAGFGSGFLGLEAPGHHRHPPNHLGHPPLPHHHSMIPNLENDRPINFCKQKANVPINLTDNNSSEEEDEPSYTEDGNCDNLNGSKGKGGSPWQRMKWTDNVVVLLIAVVSCVGDDCTLEGMDGLKRKSGVLQKKGKWKMVSKIMVSKGCYVSPQQCEDKFNDLNKRYKRLNEILGRGTSCRVVENPSLMDSMPQLSPKMKDDVKKILSSKHLFYKEMCAYHNGQMIPNFHDLGLQGFALPPTRCSAETHVSEEEENEVSEEDELDNDHEKSALMDAQRRERKGVQACDGFGVDLDGFFQDPSKSSLEQREWIKNRMLILQEQRVSLEAQSFELEKRRFKWLRFRSKKDRELERSRLENERMKLENERMSLQFKEKEMEIDFKRREASLVHSPLGIERLQGRDQQIDLGRIQ